MGCVRRRPPWSSILFGATCVVASVDKMRGRLNGTAHEGAGAGKICAVSRAFGCGLCQLLATVKDNRGLAPGRLYWRSARVRRPTPGGSVACRILQIAGPSSEVGVRGSGSTRRSASGSRHSVASPNSEPEAQHHTTPSLERFFSGLGFRLTEVRVGHGRPWVVGSSRGLFRCCAGLCEGGGAVLAVRRVTVCVWVCACL